MPNSMVAYYRRVNDLIFHKQNDWEAITPGLNDDTFTIMETLHDGAHVSFRSLLMARGFYDHPGLTMTAERFAEYIKSSSESCNTCTVCSTAVTPKRMF